MACNSYQTYPCNSGCRSCGCSNDNGRSNWDNIYFPDFVANSCCNPVCDPCDDDNNEGCNICNGGGCGCGCGSNYGGCGNHYPSCPYHGCGCGCCHRCPWYGGCPCHGGCGGSCGSCDIQPR